MGLSPESTSKIVASEEDTLRKSTQVTEVTEQNFRGK